MQSSQGGPVHSLQGPVHSLQGPVHSLQGPVHSLQGGVSLYFILQFVHLFHFHRSCMQDHDARK